MTDLATDRRAAPLLGVVRERRPPLWLLLALAFVASLPDAMLPPVLRDLLVVRYGVTPTAAHWFMAVNLVGALLAVPLLAVLRRVAGPTTLVAVAALANGVLLAALAQPIGFGWSVALRAAEGVADMVVLAVLFDLISRAGNPAWRGHRLGLGGTALMLGLAIGAIVGGAVGDGRPRAVLHLGGALGVALAAMTVAGRLLVHRADEADPLPWKQAAERTGHRPLWPALAMFASDRALAGLLAATIPLLFAGIAGRGSADIGLFIGVPMIVMALGSWPAGILGDRVGNLQLRVAAALAYAVCVAAIPLLLDAPRGVVLGAMLVMGAAASALMPTSLAIAARSRRGSVGMGAYHAAGNFGYLVGIAGAGALLGVLGGPDPGRIDYLMTIQIFALAHVATTGITLAVSTTEPARQPGATRRNDAPKDLPGGAPPQARHDSGELVASGTGR